MMVWYNRSSCMCMWILVTPELDIVGAVLVRVWPLTRPGIWQNKIPWDQVPGLWVCSAAAPAIFYHKHFPLTPHRKYTGWSGKGEHTICHPICWLFCLITAPSLDWAPLDSGPALQTVALTGFTPQTVGQQWMPLTGPRPRPGITTHLNIIIGPQYKVNSFTLLRRNVL